jgi:DNA-binding NarL/FixJ family response regulator
MTVPGVAVVGRDGTSLREVGDLVRQAGFRVVVETNSAEAAIRQTRSGAGVDLVIVDCAGSIDGVPVRELRRLPDKIRIVVLTRAPGQPWLSRLLSDGADSVLARSVTAAELGRCVRWTLDGDKVLPTGALGLLGSLVCRQERAKR